MDNIIQKRKTIIIEGGDFVVDVVEVKEFESKFPVRINVKSLEVLKKIAEAYGEPLVFFKGSIYRFYRQSVCYQYKK